MLGLICTNFSQIMSKFVTAKIYICKGKELTTTFLIKLKYSFYGFKVIGKKAYYVPNYKMGIIIFIS